MLLVPLLLAAAAAWPFDSAGLLALPSFLLFFLAQDALLAAARRHPGVSRLTRARRGRRYRLWGTIYAGGGAGCLAMALLVANAEMAPVLSLLVFTATLGIIHMFLAAAGRERHLASRLVGLSLFASTAPLEMALDGEPVGLEALGVGAIAFGYFLSTLVHVRAFRCRARPDSARRPIDSSLLSHLGAGVLVPLLWCQGKLPAIALAVLMPVVARVSWQILHPPSSIRILGLRELGVAAAFLAAAALLV